MKTLTTIALVCISTLGFSQTIITESPSFSASAVTLPKNAFQIETNFSASTEYDSENSGSTFSLPTILGRYGIGERFECRLINTMDADYYQKFNYGFGNTKVGLKYAVLGDRDSKFQLAAIVDYTLPFDDKNTITGDGILSLNYNFIPNHALTFNTGYSFSIYNSEPNHNLYQQIPFSLMYSAAVGERFTLYGEYFGDMAFSYWEYDNEEVYRSQSDAHHWDIGVLFLINDKMQIDYRFGMGMTYQYFENQLGFHVLLNSN